MDDNGAAERAAVVALTWRDRLDAVIVDGEPALLDQHLSAWIDGPEGDAFVAVLEALATTHGNDEGRPLGDAALLLQNDLWGIWQRAGAVTRSSVNAARLRELAHELMMRLAVEPLAVESVAPDVIPAPLARVLEGYAVRESEMPMLQHELAFGGRRVFHVATRGTTRALYSTLVGIDADGSLYLTDVVGDLEMLTFFGDALVEARVFELERAAVGTEQGADSMIEASEAHRVPGAGRNSTVAIFEPPVPLTELPCASCHDDAQMMSLPSIELPVGERIDGVLRFAAERAP